jgi:hypothetical protein
VVSQIPGLKSLVPGIRAGQSLRSQDILKWVRVLVVVTVILAVAMISAGRRPWLLASLLVFLVVVPGLAADAPAVIVTAPGVIGFSYWVLFLVPFVCGGCCVGSGLVGGRTCCKLTRVAARIVEWSTA